MAIVYNRLVRPDTTGGHCEKALRALGVDTIHLHPWRPPSAVALPFRAGAALRACYPNGFVGNAYGAEMNRVHNASRIVVNLSVGSDVNATA